MEEIIMDTRKGYRKLKVWEKAHDFAMEVYRTSKNFPKEELYGLTSQIRRASFSIPINIVEGHASNSRKEFLSFLNIANRSLVETEYLLDILQGIAILDKESYLKLERLRREVAVIMNSFIRGLRNKC